MFIPPEETVVTVLSHVDSFTVVGQLSSMFSYILDRKANELVQEDSVRAAAGGVARKWRLWAGRVEWSAKLLRWTVRVPLGALPLAADYPLVHLTASTVDTPCPKHFLLCPTRSTCALTPAADRALSTHPSAALDLATLAKRRAPLVQIHLSTFRDVQIVGVCICHGLADGKGMGMWARAFSAELNGQAWEAPPVERGSRVDAAVEVLQAELEGEGELAAAAERSVATGEGGLLDGAMPASLLAILKAGWALAVEYMWHGLQDGGAFLGHDVVNWLVARTKKDIDDLTGGKEFVSTYDVLIAWLLKAAYADEPHHSPLKPTGVMCVRSTLSAATAHGGPSLTTPPLALNAAWFYNFPAGPDPHSASLADLALHHRRSLLASRTPSALAANLDWLEGFHARHERAPLFISTGFDSWGFSNQTNCGVADAVDWGRGRGRAQLYTCRQAPEFKDNMCIVTRQEMGWVWTGMLRKSRWASIGRALERLQNEWREETQAGAGA